MTVPIQTWVVPYKKTGDFFDNFTNTLASYFEGQQKYNEMQKVEQARGLGILSNLLQLPVEQRQLFSDFMAKSYGHLIPNLPNILSYRQPLSPIEQVQADVLGGAIKQAQPQRVKIQAQEPTRTVQQAPTGRLTPQRPANLIQPQAVPPMWTETGRERGVETVTEEKEIAGIPMEYQASRDPLLFKMLYGREMTKEEYLEAQLPEQQAIQAKYIRAGLALGAEALTKLEQGETDTTIKLLDQLMDVYGNFVKYGGDAAIFLPLANGIRKRLNMPEMTEAEIRAIPEVGEKEKAQYQKFQYDLTLADVKQRNKLIAEGKAKEVPIGNTDIFSGITALMAETKGQSVYNMWGHGNNECATVVSESVKRGGVNPADLNVENPAAVPSWQKMNGNLIYSNGDYKPKTGSLKDTQAGDIVFTEYIPGEVPGWGKQTYGHMGVADGKGGYFNDSASAGGQIVSTPIPENAMIMRIPSGLTKLMPLAKEKKPIDISQVSTPSMWESIDSSYLAGGGDPLWQTEFDVFLATTGGGASTLKSLPFDRHTEIVAKYLPEFNALDMKQKNTLKAMSEQEKLRRMGFPKVEEKTKETEAVMTNIDTALLNIDSSIDKLDQNIFDKMSSINDKSRTAIDALELKKQAAISAVEKMKIKLGERQEKVNTITTNFAKRINNYTIYDPENPESLSAFKNKYFPTYQNQLSGLKKQKENLQKKKETLLQPEVEKKAILQFPDAPNPKTAIELSDSILAIQGGTLPAVIIRNFVDDAELLQQQGIDANYIIRKLNKLFPGAPSNLPKVYQDPFKLPTYPGTR